MSDVPPQSRRRRWPIVVLAALLAASLATAGAAWWLGRDDSATRALTYARKACKAINLGPPSQSADATDAAGQAKIWQPIADNAARAARLDPAWNALARATDTEARAWILASQSNPPQSQKDATLAELNAHPVDPECRKALVN
jgi:hypothetical protein